MITLEKLNKQDFPALYKFELENRNYFAKNIPDRGDDYFIEDNFLKRNYGLLDEQESQQSFFFLIKNAAGQLIGRINLVDIDWEKQSGELGYRIGENYCGKGITTQAVTLLFEEAIKLGVKVISAQTTNNNLGSQKVLKKNGFVLLKKDYDFFEFNGDLVYFMYYQKQL